METSLYVEINLFGIFLLAVMLFNDAGKRQAGQRAMDEILFRWVVVGNIAVLIADSGIILLDSKTFFGARAWLLGITLVYYLLNVGVCWLWAFYSDYKMNHDKEGLRRRAWWYSMPMLLSAALCAISLRNGWIFRITPENAYQRGPYMPIVTLVCFGYYIYTILQVLSRTVDAHTEEEKDVYRYLVIFPLLPFFASLIQTVYYGLPLIWPATAISLLMIFVNIQNRQISTDTLTGLYNRRQLAQYLESRARTTTSGMLFCILIDVDDFKQINDRFGHLTGDLALSQTAALLRASCTDREFVARYGGDEFVITGHKRNEEQIRTLIDSILQGVQAFNAAKKANYTLALSIGYAIMGESGVNTIDLMMHIADKRMYQQKSEKCSRRTAAKEQIG